MVLDIFALAVMLLLLGVVIWLVVLLGNMPGEIARKNNHPQARAITALGWAYYKPGAADSDLQQRVKDLENQLQQIQAGGGES